jgi:uncharacterized protein involved in exopolysaccharide biosynthesis
MRLAGTEQFLDSQLALLAQRLAEKKHELKREKAQGRSEPSETLAMDYQLLQERYRTLFAKHEDAKMAEDLAVRQSGNMLFVQDQANLPTRSIKPNRLAISGIGALVGCALGGTAAFGLYRRHRRVLA